MIFVRDARAGITVNAKPDTGSIYTAVLLLASGLLIASQLAQAGELDKVVAFDIARTTLDKALLEFGTQERLQIMFAWNSSTVSLPTRELEGNYTGKQALATILQGTRLTYIERGHTLEILPKASADSSPTARGRKLLEVQPGGETKTSNRTASKSPDPQFTNRQSQNGEPPQALGEVIVTAQKYRQLAFDVPISLDVITARDLGNLRISSLDSLQYELPGVYINDGAGFNRITLDGVGNGIGSGALVGEYIDDADMTGSGLSGSTGVATSDVSLTDVSRVEALHGPQGTLYGDGALGGVIRVITNKPDLYSTQFSSDVAALFSQYGAPSQSIQTMLNVPLVAGTFGLRFAGQFEHDGGWIDEPEANAKNINSSNLADVRVEALWQPSARLTVNAMQIVRREAFGLGWGENPPGYIAAPLPFGLATVPQAETDFALSNVTVSYVLTRVKLLSSSTYFNHSLTYDNSFETFQTSPLLLELAHHYAYTDNDYSEELRLSNAEQGRWEWMIGGFYKHYGDTDNADEDITFSEPAAPVINYTIAGLNTGSTSTATFANTSYRATRRLTLGAGVRYFRVHETYNFPTQNYHGYAGLGVIPGIFEAGNFTSIDPRYFAQYRVSSGINTYASASKGFREGGFNGTGLPTYQPELLTRYDAGLKSRILANRMEADMDIFYSAYSNYVIDGFDPVLNEYYEGNAGTAHIKGVEPSLKWRLSSAWSLGLNGEYVDAKFVRVSLLDSGYAVGDRVPFTTKYSFSATVERDFQWHDKSGVVVASYSDTSGVQFHQTGYIYAVANSAVMRFLGVNGNIDLNHYLSLGIFGKNLLNDRGYMDPQWLYGEGSRPQPRTFGVDFRVNFGSL